MKLRFAKAPGFYYGFPRASSTEHNDHILAFIPENGMDANASDRLSGAFFVW
jgi:hypothetical protein